MGRSRSTHAAAVETATPLDGPPAEQVAVATATAPPVAPEPKKAKESKAERFVRLAKWRMPKALKQLASIKALANKSTYTYSQSQAMKIVDDLNDAVKAIRQAFSGEVQFKAEGWDFEAAPEGTTNA